MLELLLCSMLTVLPDYLYRRYVQGKRLGQRDQPLYGVVRAALGHHRLPRAHRLADHDDLLLPPVDEERHRDLPHRHHPARGLRPGGRGLCGRQREGRGRPAAVPARRCRAARRRWRRPGGASPRWRRRRWWPRPSSRRRTARSRRRGARWRRRRRSSTSGPSCAGAIPTPSRCARSSGCRWWSTAARARSTRRSPTRRRSRPASPRRCRRRRRAPRPRWRRRRSSSTRRWSRPAWTAWSQQFTLRPGDVVNPIIRTGRHPRPRRVPRRR